MSGEVGEPGTYGGDEDGSLPLEMRAHWTWAAQPEVSGAYIRNSTLKDDFLAVIHALSTQTIDVQTDAPSYTSKQVDIDWNERDARVRSVGLQCAEVKQATDSAQADEEDIDRDYTEGVSGVVHRSGGTRAAVSHALLGDFGDGTNMPLVPRDYTGAETQPMHSSYRPWSAIAVGDYPTFMTDATAVGIANRYGFISLPKPSVELPVRRADKVVEPADVKYLFGPHSSGLDDEVSTRVSRAYDMWAKLSGFEPHI